MSPFYYVMTKLSYVRHKPFRQALLKRHDSKLMSFEHLSLCQSWV